MKEPPTHNDRVEIVPGRRETNGATDDHHGWWEQYRQSIRREGRLSDQAIGEIERVSRSVSERLSTAQTTVCRGAVLGAVQSGKTGVMGGIAAMGLDAGFQVVIVLAGLREDLRVQTARRLTRELLDRGDRIPEWLDGTWTFSDSSAYNHVLGKGYHGAMTDCWSPHFHHDITSDQAFQYDFVNALRRGKRVFVVVKKNARVLERLHAALSDAKNSLPGGPPSVLVLDDECDEASVGELRGERPTSDSIKNLVLPSGGQSVAYVGITATIAANILQDTQDALFPSHFVEVARYPAETDTALTFAEPDARRRYTGGFVFYRLLEEAGHPNCLVRRGISEDEQAGTSSDWLGLEEALIAYFVAGAMRLRRGYSFLDAAHAPEPHCMMIHTDGRIQSHRILVDVVADLIQERAGRPVDDGHRIRRDPANRIDAAACSSWLDKEPHRWKAWYDAFCSTQRVFDLIVPGITRAEPPSWSVVQNRLRDVFAAVKVRVVNSDEASDEPPLEFGSAAGDGRPPYDTYSIIIGGNRLSRGLTIQGLCVSYYTRVGEGVILEDVTSQRGRWFGYRAEHLEYCRLFLTPSTSRLFEAFYENDADLRRQFAWMIREGRSPADTAVRMMCLPNSRPTARASRGERVHVSFSGSRVFQQDTQSGNGEEELAAAEWNEELAAKWWRRLQSDGQVVEGSDGRPRGYLLGGISSAEAAKLLDGFRFTFHNPDPTRRLGVTLQRFHREQSSDYPEAQGMKFGSCPYAVAAYLRFWEAAYAAPVSRNECASYRGPDGASAWDPISAPRFNVGFRFGDMDEEADGPFVGARLLNRWISSSGRVESRWGGHGTSEGNYGDEWFDIDPASGDPHEPRSATQPGLILIHVGHREARGRRGDGSAFTHHRPFLGICIPQGGPAFEAVVASPPQ